MHYKRILPLTIALLLILTLCQPIFAAQSEIKINSPFPTKINTFNVVIKQI